MSFEGILRYLQTSEKRPFHRFVHIQFINKAPKWLCVGLYNRDMPDISKAFLEWLKLSPRYLLPLLTLCSFLLFSPKAFLLSLGIFPLVETYRPWIGIAFLLFLVLVLSSGIAWAIETLKAKLAKFRTKKLQPQIIQMLSPSEKTILAQYIIRDSKTNYLSISNGLAQGLVNRNILYLASNMSISGFTPELFAYNLQPWVWELLKAKPELLEPQLSEVKKAETGKRRA